MLFNSLEFLGFFAVVVSLYFALPFSARWVLLLGGSYVFYGAWKPEYLILIWASTLVDYVAGLRMGALPDRRSRRPWLIASLVLNLGLLGVFKYFNFFNESLRVVFEALRLGYDIPALEVLLPVGISFYTFQSLSYSIDVYRGDREAERHLGYFALYVSYFPQLVAGPIERSTHLLPQLREKVAFSRTRLREGLTLILFGFFKKIVIADRLAIYVQQVFDHPGEHHGATVLMATYFFMWQVYCDFSGYSDIAIGTGRIMGHDLMTNFRRPYFSASIAEFWKRWHISLSTWFRDYLYIPLGGSRVSRLRGHVNILIVFGVSGLWHGAEWTKVIWGLMHGVYMVVGAMTANVRERIFGLFGGATRGLRRVVAVVVTFHLCSLGLMLFRSPSVADFGVHFRCMLEGGESPWQIIGPLSPYELTLAFVFLGVLILIHALQEQKDSDLVAELGASSRWVRWPVHYFFLFTVLMFGEYNLTPFFYFQF